MQFSRVLWNCCECTRRDINRRTLPSGCGSTRESRGAVKSELGPTRGAGIGQTSGLWARTCVCASLSTPVSLNCSDQPHLPTLQAETVWALELTPESAGESSTGGDGRRTDGPRPQPQEWPQGRGQAPHAWRTSPPSCRQRVRGSGRTASPALSAHSSCFSPGSFCRSELGTHPAPHPAALLLVGQPGQCSVSGPRW